LRSQRKKCTPLLGHSNQRLLLGSNLRELAAAQTALDYYSRWSYKFNLLKLSNVFHRNLSDFFESEVEMSEKELKNLLISKIESAGYNDCKRLFSVVKIFMDI